MHTDNGTVEIGRIRLALLFHEIEVRYRTGIVVLNGIGIETYELHPAGDETEIRFAENHLVSLVSGSQAVMVAEQYHKRHLQLLQSVSGPLKFLRSSKVCDISAVKYEINTVLAPVDIIHFLFRSSSH